MNESHTWNRIYNILICVLAIASVALAVLDLTRGLSPVLLWVDRIIYVFFLLDYFVRLALAREKGAFFKQNILDLIAILPFNSAFRAFRLLRLSKALRLTKLLRVASVSSRMLVKTKGLLNTNGFKYVLVLSGAAILCSSFAMTHFEGMTFLDALWWSFVTTTTVGYGDLSPATGPGRIVAAILMIVGIGLIGSLTSSITSFFLRPEDRKPVSFDKVEMALTVYGALSDEEQEIFWREINSNRSPSGGGNKIVEEIE